MEQIIEIQNRIYQVETRVLKQAVRRNMERFPEDFMVILSEAEVKRLILNGGSQIVIPPGYNTGGAGMFAFTEQGVAMLSSILRSKYAIQINIMRAFASMHSYIMSAKLMETEVSELREKLLRLEKDTEDNLEAINGLSEDMQSEIDNIYKALAALSVRISPPEPNRTRQKIGFKTGGQ